MTVLITIAIIAVLILAHELGHFIAAKRIGIPIYEFSLGFGYKLLSIRHNGIDYSLRLIPLGGFVRMAGEEPGDMDDPRGFSKRTPFEKIRVAFAGPFMNIVMALLIFIYSYAFIGIPIVSNEPVIGRVLAGEPAVAAGIQPGDRVLKVNGVQVNTWTDFTRNLSATDEGKAVELQIEREERVINLSVTPKVKSSTGLPAIGVMSAVSYEKQGVVRSVVYGLQQTYELTLLLLGSLWLMITGGVSAGDLAGPVGIAAMAGEAAQIGLVFLLGFAAFLSINLGILNLLPIPALDGSRIVFAIIEAIRRKPIEPEKEGFIHWLGFVFLMLLILIVTYNDIIKLIKG